MKNIIKILFVGIVTLLLASCEGEPDSKDIATGVIRFPSIIVEGEDPIVVQSGQSYTDPGAKAYLGEDDITNELETVSTVDTDIPGVYQVNYTVTTVNELDQESTVTVSRIVSVTDGDVSDVELAGTYKRDNNPANATVTVIKIKDGVFQSDNMRGSATNIFSGRIFAIGNDELVVPVTNSPFGRVEGTGTITGTGYSYTLTFLDPPNTGATNFRNFVKQ